MRIAALAVCGLGCVALAEAPPPAVKLTAFDPMFVAHYGQTVATDGEFIVIGAPGVGEPPDYYDGAIYVYSAVTHEFLYKWETDEAPLACIGGGLVVRDGIGVFGGPCDEVAAVHSGTAFIVDLATGESLGRLFPPVAQERNAFGFAMAMDGDTLVVGSPHAYPEGIGYATVFDVNALSVRFLLMPSEVEPGEQFGIATAIDDEFIIVGTSRITNTPSINSVYVYNRHTGEQLRVIDAPLGYGYSTSNNLATDGERIFYGLHEPQGNQRVGVVHVFNIASGERLQSIYAPPEAGRNSLGAAITLTDRHMIVGGIGGGGPSQIYIYDLKSLELVARIDEPLPGLLLGFGSSLAVAGDLLVAGSPNDGIADPYTPHIGAAWLIDISQYNRPADLNSDGLVDETDLAMLLAAWGGAEHDLDGDGIVGSRDVATLLSRWACE